MQRIIFKVIFRLVSNQWLDNAIARTESDLKSTKLDWASAVKNLKDVEEEITTLEAFKKALFWFLGVGKKFRLLMQSCRFFVFFSPNLSMKMANFSKTVLTIFIKFCTVILHPKRPLRAQRHQNCMTRMSET